MATADYNELFEVAKESFINGDYKTAEPLLQQALLKNNHNPEVFHMLGTIFYDRGKFNKAIQTFKRALEIDPTYTDASVGLSIILNDLGRYDEGREIFAKAEEALEKQRGKSDPFVEKQLAQKHEELGDLYQKNRQPDEALEQFMRARKLSVDKESLTLKIADSFLSKNGLNHALRELRSFIRENPGAARARLKLGRILYDSDQVVEAIDQWESLLYRNPNHVEARELVRIAQRRCLTSRELGPQELV